MRSWKDLLLYCEFITLSVSFITLIICNYFYFVYFPLSAGEGTKGQLCLCYAWPVVGIQKLSLWLDKLKVFNICSSTWQAPSHSVLYNNTNIAQGCWFSCSEARPYKSVFGDWSSLILMWDPVPAFLTRFLFVLYSESHGNNLIYTLISGSLGSLMKPICICTTCLSVRSHE